jgi:translation initiation factor 2 subunit 1
MKYSGWPEVGELVVCQVVDIEDFGVFCDLQEYEEKRGLIHISEVASGWIKNIRDHVKKGHLVVCKILTVSESNHQIDLSLKDVNDHQRSEKIQEWKNEQKADKWLELALGSDLSNDQFNRIVPGLLNKYGTLYAAFECAVIDGKSAFDELDLTGKEIDSIISIALENISLSKVSISGYVDLECSAPDGIDAIRDALKSAEESITIPPDVELDVIYVGSPEYLITIVAPDYKLAESLLDQYANYILQSIVKNGGTGKFHRDRHIDEDS